MNVHIPKPKELSLLEQLTYKYLKDEITTEEFQKALQDLKGICKLVDVTTVDSLVKKSLLCG